MGKRFTLPKQNFDTDIPLMVSDVHHKKYFIRALDILRLDVKDHIVSATLKKSFPLSPVFIRGSLTLVLCKLPYHHFIQVKDNCAFNVEFIHEIDAVTVMVNSGETVDFSRHYYKMFNHRG